MSAGVETQVVELKDLEEILGGLIHELQRREML